MLKSKWIELCIFTVFDRLVQAVSCFIERQQVVEMLIPAQVGVYPVGEGELFLRPHRVGRAWRQIRSRQAMDHPGIIYIEDFFATNMLHFNGANRQITFLYSGGDTPYWHQVIIITEGPSCRMLLLQFK